MNVDRNMRADCITQAVNRLDTYINRKEKTTSSAFQNDNNDEIDSDDEIRPMKGFAKPLSKYKSIEDARPTPEKTNRLLKLIYEHIEEALKNGFDDSIAKYKGKSHFVVGFFSLNVD